MNLVEALKRNNLTISCAESLTAGLVASEICSISGASDVFKGGIVSYTKEIKCNLLGLSMENINKYSVYSNETVIAMALGVMNKTQSDIAIATSGVAGPGPDEGVEAGTVYFCVRVKDKSYTEKKKFEGTRNEVRLQAAKYAVEMAYNSIK